MRTTTAKRGSTAKFLALTASLTMMVTGLIGVAVAGPASAESANLDCQYLPAAPQGQSWVYLDTIQVGGEQTTYTWTYSAGGVYGWVVKSSTAYNWGTYATPQTTGTVASTSTNDNNQLQGISHVSLCGLTPLTTPTTSLTVTKAWAGTNGDASNELAAKLGPADAGTLAVTVNAAATGQAWGATKTDLEIGATAVVSEGTVPALDPADFPTGYRCSLAENYPTYSANDFALAATANTVTVTNAVACTAVLPNTTSLRVTKAWVGTNGAQSDALAADLRSADAGTLTVTVDGDATGQAWGDTKFDLEIGDTAVVSEGVVPALDAADFPAGYTCTVVTTGYPVYSANNFALAATATTVTVTNAVACTADSTPTVIVTPPVVETPAVVVTPPVVEAAVVVAAPLPATVAVPVEKPVVVSAPKPAQVTGGVVSTATIPQAATIPAAVPAGDGSQAPGLPMWALALMVIGALGAAVAGKQILEARN